MMWQTPQPLDFVLLVRGFFLVCCAVILSARLSPSIQKRFLSYGPRSPSQGQNASVSGPKITDAYLTQTLDWAARLQVPHRWFTHFYLLSTALTLFLLVHLSVSESDSIDASPNRLAIGQLRPFLSQVACMILMLVQGVRRLYECLFVLKPSNSTMWIGHYAFGLAFYAATNAAIWLETLARQRPFTQKLFETRSPPWPYKTQVGILVFSTASVVQHIAHSDLARLKKYTLPSSRLFRLLVAPHYSAEVAIYLGMAIVGAAPGSLFNATMLCIALLTAVNLGITAEGTRRWMLEKFRDDHDTVSHRYCLVPGIW